MIDNKKFIEMIRRLSECKGILSGSYLDGVNEDSLALLEENMELACHKINGVIEELIELKFGILEK